MIRKYYVVGPIPVGFEIYATREEADARLEVLTNNTYYPTVEEHEEHVDDVDSRAGLYARCLERDREVHYSEGWYDTYDYTSASADELGADVLPGVSAEASLQVR